MKIYSLLIWLFCIALNFSTQALAHEHLGQIHFAATGKKEAAPYFEKGVLLLHNFQYDEARASFRQAEKIDPDFVLAYWGEAMTFNHPLWGEQDYQQAVTALAHLAPNAEARVAKAKTDREKGFIMAINALYGKGDKATRDSHYVDAMQALYRANPNDEEIALLYSLALLGSAESERDVRVYMQAAGVAEDVYMTHQLHPGALHYAIHAYDDPIHAPLGLRAARAYAAVAPSSSHALHMPSHIFAALGMWDDVIKSNQAAWEVGVKQNKTGDANAYTVHDMHALQWLAYAHLQKKHYQIALALNKKMQEIAEKSNSAKAKWYYAQMRSAYLIESGDYSAPLKSLDMQGVELSAYADNVYADVMIKRKHGDVKGMTELLHTLDRAIPAKMPNKTFADYFTSVTKSGVAAAEVVKLEVKAQIAFCRRQYDAGVKYLRAAVKLEDKMSYGYGPPIPVVPSFELLGEVMVRNKRYNEGFQEYMVALQRMPNRWVSVRGLDEVRRMMWKTGVVIPQGVKPYFHRLILPEFYH